MARDDAVSVMSNRFPAPLFRECCSGDSQSRFLLAKLNPSVTQNTVQGYGGQGAPPVFTDDVSLKIFMEHLRKLAVQH
jgi:protein transport protein SEC23